MRGVNIKLFFFPRNTIIQGLVPTVELDLNNSLLDEPNTHAISACDLKTNAGLEE